MARLGSAVPDDAPSSLRDLGTRLRANGFDERVGEQAESFGDQIVEYERAPLRVRLVRDRGKWFLELSGRRWKDNEWFDPDIWRACIFAEDPPVHPRCLEEQAGFVVRELADLEREMRRGRSLRKCLDAHRTRRSHERLGF